MREQARPIPEAKIKIAPSSPGLRPGLKHYLTAYGFMLPYLLVFFLFLFLPAAAGFIISLTDWRILGTPHYIGLDNYKTILEDRLFWRAVRNTLKFTLATVIPMVGGGLMLAVLFNEKLKGRVVARTIVFLPYAIMVTIIGLLWRWIYDRNFGLANYYLGELGLDPINWLNQTTWPLYAIAITTIWWQLGVNMIIYLAGLQEIPQELYDASKVDGASAFQRLVYVTIPGLRLIHIFVIPMSVIAALRVFGQVQVMTAGGPAGATHTLVQHLYKVGWVNKRQGEGAAVGVILFLLTFALTLLQLQYFRALDFNLKEPSLSSKKKNPLQRVWDFGKGLLNFVFMLLGWAVQEVLDFVSFLLRPFAILGEKASALVPKPLRGSWITIIGYPIMIVVAVLWIVPIAWMYSTALKPEGRVREVPIQWVTEESTFSNFDTVVKEYDIEKWFLNSLNVAIATTVLAVVIYILAAYPLAFYRFRGKGVLFLGIMATMLIPVEATMIPLFIALAKLKMADTYLSLILPVAGSAFGLYLLVQFFQTIPTEFIDAARIDGANELVILRRIIIPLARPAIVTVAILTFMASWNNFVWPFIVTTDAHQTLPVGLAITMGSITGSPNAVKYGVVMAGSVVSTLPPMLIFIFLQRYFVQGLSMSGIKG
jgi:ABC-type sugar transport system permease subunit